MRFPIIAHDVVARTAPTCRGEHREHFVAGFAAIKRRNQRLNDGGGSIKGAGITPRFQRVRLGNVPMTELRGFIIIKTEMDARLDFGKLGGKIKLCRRGENRVAAKHEQHLDFSRFHVGRQLAQRFDLIRGSGFNRIRINHGFAGIAERVIHRMCQRMHRRRLLLACNHETRAAMVLQIAG
ncbi:MAG: hypothetical protein ALAOOOJD_04215 [bacterium]|nr:hypothetical protein [bacterium]